MRRNFRNLGVWLAAVVALSLSAFAAKGQTFTGEVSDAMCGAKHMMTGDAAQCAHDCAAKGSNYALVVGDKVYGLETKDKTMLDKLSQLAGQKATVAGKADDETIDVTAVSAAK